MPRTPQAHTDELCHDRDQARSFARWFMWWAASPEHTHAICPRIAYRGLVARLDEWSNNPEVPDALSALAANHALTRFLEEYRFLAVNAARRAGATWALIGDALDLDATNARQRYGRAALRHLDRGAEFHRRAGAS
jgi:hypothetical protein